MVSSYLICDTCGQYGPPASVLSHDGLRLCYCCWYAAQSDAVPAMTDRKANAGIVEGEAPSDNHDKFSGPVHDTSCLNAQDV